MLTRRNAMRLAASTVAMPFVSTTGWAQVYPSRTITMIVSFAPGGTTDVAARIIGEYMSKALRQQVIIENVAGAGGTTGAIRAMRARADGYTLMMGQMGTHAVASAIIPNLAYKPDVDFAPIGLVLETPYYILARKDFPPKDLKEFVTYVKANADKLNAAHAGVGSQTHAYTNLLNTVLSVKPTMVPFNGAAPSMNALVGGQVDYMCNSTLESSQQVLSGLIKAYAIAAPERHSILPNVPTTIEAGLPEFQALGWYALFAPKDVPQSVLDQLTDLLDKALDDEAVRKRLFELGGADLSKGKRGQRMLTSYVKSEIARWNTILKAE